MYRENTSGQYVCRPQPTRPAAAVWSVVREVPYWRRVVTMMREETRNTRVGSWVDFVGPVYQLVVSTVRSNGLLRRGLAVAPGPLFVLSFPRRNIAHLGRAIAARRVLRLDDLVHLVHQQDTNEEVHELHQEPPDKTRTDPRKRLLAFHCPIHFPPTKISSRVDHGQRLDPPTCTPLHRVDHGQRLDRPTCTSLHRVDHGKRLDRPTSAPLHRVDHGQRLDLDVCFVQGQIKGALVR